MLAQCLICYASFAPRSFITNKPDEIEAADKLILPGVGHFDRGMDNLKASGLIDLLNTQVLEHQKPIMGICLGMQMMTRGSEEGNQPGLGWVAADTLKFLPSTDCP